MSADADSDVSEAAGRSGIHRSTLSMERRLGQELDDRFSGLRRTVGPFLVILGVVFAGAEPTLWRRGVALLAAALVVVAEIHASLSRHPLRAARRHVVGVVLGLCALLVATGGLLSPAIVLVPATVLLTALVGGRPAAKGAWFLTALGALALATAQIAWGRQWLPPSLWHDDRPTVALAVSFAVALPLGLVLVIGAARRVRESLQAQLARTHVAQDLALTHHEARNHDLLSLSGEIAHELKNPLASVKGLAALVHKDLEGKTSERMGVLRREVDRMQRILEEFLEFSRPLLPLHVQEVGLDQLLEEVVALHEGMAADREVTFTMAVEEHEPVACDSRKILQILVNLVQNALDVVPSGSAIALAARVEGDRAIITVVDDGPGLDPATRRRVFDPGVTTKPKGSGLGLTVARALAQQHGGDLTLEDDEGPHGCRATLWWRRDLDETRLREPM